MDEKHQQLLVNNVHTFDFKHDNPAFKFTTKEEGNLSFLSKFALLVAYATAAMPGSNTD
jgi:hypothetical protein